MIKLKEAGIKDEICYRMVTNFNESEIKFAIKAKKLSLKKYNMNNESLYTYIKG